MYNKLFAKILDSSIWLESTTTRIVWLTFLAAMDESGFVQFASVPNVALRARVPLPAAEKAIACLEGPDANSADPDHEGRRIEKVPGGWVVLNAEKYRDLVTRAIQQAQTRARVAKHRANKRGNAPVTADHVTCNAPVTPSETETDTEREKDQKNAVRKERAPSADFAFAWAAYPRKTGKGAAEKAWEKAKPPLQAVLDAIAWQKNQPGWKKDRGQFVPHMSTWLNQRRWEDEPFDPVSTNDDAFREVDEFFERERARK
jgi:hypothetical protein